MVLRKAPLFFLSARTASPSSKWATTSRPRPGCIEDRGCSPETQAETLGACSFSGGQEGSLELVDDGLTEQKQILYRTLCNEIAQLTENGAGEECDARFVARTVSAYEDCRRKCFDCERRVGDREEGERRNSDEPDVVACLEVWSP